jgi:hypothetical protein
VQTVGVWDPTAHTGLPLEVLLGRTVLLTVARWFLLSAQETVDNFLQVWAAWRGAIPYFLVWIFIWWVSHPDFGAPRPGREHNHQVCWDQVSHI